MNLTLTAMEKVSLWEGRGTEEGIALQVCSVSGGICPVWTGQWLTWKNG